MKEPRDLGLFSDPHPIPTVCARCHEPFLNEAIVAYGNRDHVHFRCRDFDPKRFLHESQLADLRRAYRVFTQARADVKNAGAFIVQSHRAWTTRPSYELWQQIERRLNTLTETLRRRHLEHILDRRPR